MSEPTSGGTEPAPIVHTQSEPGKNHVSIQAFANFSLDDAQIFDLNGEGITVTIVTSN
jgi:hypothetical protein